MSQKRILVVDDEPQLVEMVEMRLQAAGYEVLKGHDGQQGLDLAKEHQPDLIILDVMMPKMDGYKVCGLLKSDARFKDIPIVLFTARAQDSDRELGEELGADAYINKPLVAEEIIKTVKDLLGDT